MGGITFRADQAGTYAKAIAEDKCEVTLYLSEQDGQPVIEIDTEHNVGEIRVHLNDGRIWTGDPEKGPGSTLRPNAARALREYEAWSLARQELSDAENDDEPEIVDWSASDDEAVNLVHLMADTIRRSANYLTEEGGFTS